MASARKEAAVRFCEMFRLPKSASFKNSVYGDDGVVILAVGWMDRMRTLVDVWRESSFHADFHFSATGLVWNPPLDFDNLRTTTVHPGTQRRTEEIMRIRPW